MVPFTTRNFKSEKRRQYTGYYDNINSVTSNLKQLFLVANKFRKDDVDIRLCIH